MISLISLRGLVRPVDGQDLLEYGLLASLIAIVVLAGVRLIGYEIGTVFWGTIGDNF
jgi:Flp pilus assembly pilin Flp